MRDQSAVGSKLGAISALSVGKDAYMLTVSTLGGYVAAYDLRYGVTSTIHKHSFNAPILALATYLKRDGKAFSSVLSLGGQSGEMCLMNMETGKIDILLKPSSSKAEESNSNSTLSYSMP